MRPALLLVVAACGASGFPTAAHPPLPVIPDHGGPRMTAPRLVTVTFAGYELADDVERYGDWMMRSAWLETVGADFGFGRGSHTAKVRLRAAPPQLSPADLALLLVDRIRDGSVPALPEARLEVVYILYIPPGTSLIGAVGGGGRSLQSCRDYGGYHDRATDDAGPFAYAVIPTCDAGSTRDTLAGIELAASHELAEAATDPRTSPEQAAWVLAEPLNAWAPPDRGGEVADLCEIGYPAYRDGDFFAQRVWSNSAAQRGDDPCVPAPDGPWFNVSASPDGVVTVAPGTTVTLRLTGFSTGPVADWDVDLRMLSGASDFVPAVHVDRETINNGKQGTATLMVPGDAPAGGMAEGFIRSRRDGHTRSVWPILLRVNSATTTAAR